MDTDDLSQETHDAIIIEAEKFHHDLTLQFGVLASACKSDDDYLNKSELLIKYWQTDWDIDEIVTEIFFDNPPSNSDFKKILNKILKNIQKVRKIPMDQRKYEAW